MPPAPSVASSERAARYLRRHDKIGYLTTLALPPELVDAWTELYVQARELDRVSEAEEKRTHSAPDSLAARLLALRPELAPIIAEGARWPKVEQALYADPAPRSVADYFDLMYYRGFCPVYTCAVLAMPEEDRRWLEAFSVFLGVGGQLIDDTLDLVEDVGQGLLFVTTEELDALALSPTDLGTAAGVRRVTELRNQWALAYHLEAYRVTSAFRPANRRLARSFLEFSMRALLDGRVRPLPAEVLADQERFMERFGIVSHLFDLPFPNEACRRAAARPFVNRVVRRYSLASIGEARARYEAGPAVPPELLVEQVHGLPRVDVAALTEDLPDGRRSIALLHYGAPGLLPTAVDVVRVMVGL